MRQPAASLFRSSVFVAALAFTVSGALGQQGKGTVPSNTAKSTPLPPRDASQDPGKTPGHQAPSTGNGGIALSDNEFHLDSVGLHIRLPMGAEAESVRIGDRTTVQISPVEAKWLINIQTPVTSNEKATPREVADRTIEAIQASVGVLVAVDHDVKFTDSQAKLFDRVDDLKLPGGGVSRFYVSVPSDADARSKARLVKGYTIFKPGPKQFVIFELICGEPDFSKARIAYETSVGTASFENSDTIATSRRNAIHAGLELFSHLPEQAYLDAMGSQEQETWYRLYVPSSTGSIKDDEELGYRGVKFWKGFRGEIDPKNPRTSWTPADKVEGYLAQDRSRVLVNGMIADSVTICFMTPDRTEETWSSTTAVKDRASGKPMATVNEIGSRLKDDVTVVTNESSKPTKTTKPAIAGDGYISQFERSLLPRLLARQHVSKEYGFYAWDTLSRSIVFRRDTVEGRQTSMAKDAKIWNVVTTIRDESKKQTTTVSDKGEVLGVSLEDNRTWDLIDVASLRSLWKEKGLPTDH